MGPVTPAYREPRAIAPRRRPLRPRFTCSGLPASTLRYYEQRGLITSNGRRGLRGQFDAQVLERLALISLGRRAGLALDEITPMLTDDGRPHVDRALLAAKADELERTIARLSAMRDGLRHAATCPATDHADG
ncbi:helix-turn-helix domain-containing protein [Conexibacter stalactiti]|uniref:Helix-turn-helix domain-containing protein n=1 Tax=Conexibacter stalactiti TaxID=1940611 RepID=A0ABU4HI88_9ACTN|nr:helix-turn-helix domain-containing protein [Conexibacter stalactiti]MDW5593034.1 helix-turn-helix domain-containing protein [Conexibacter stalactiti]MEC5033675.1 helix-turn-helix domain-containing protein [Conexibacter stalactiti]